MRSKPTARTAGQPQISGDACVTRRSLPTADAVAPEGLGADAPEALASGLLGIPMDTRDKVNLRGKAKGFTIPEGLAPHIKVIGGLDSLEHWEAKVWLGNSGTRNHTNVGLVAFDRKTGTIVPVAGSDEHQNGWELIQHLRRKKLIPDLPYHMMATGINFPPDGLDPKDTVATYKAWRAGSGPNSPVRALHPRPGFFGSMDDYIAAEGKVQANMPEGSLSPLGTRLITSLEALSTLLIKHHLGAKVSDKAILAAGRKTLAEFNTLRGLPGFIVKDQDIERAQHGLDALEMGQGSEPFEQAISSHNGLKNKVHIALRDFGNNRFWDEDLKLAFGDPAFARQEFDRLGSAERSVAIRDALGKG